MSQQATKHQKNTGAMKWVDISVPERSSRIFAELRVFTAIKGTSKFSSKLSVLCAAVTFGQSGQIV